MQAAQSALVIGNATALLQSFHLLPAGALKWAAKLARDKDELHVVTASTLAASMQACACMKVCVWDIDPDCFDFILNCVSAVLPGGAASRRPPRPAVRWRGRRGCPVIELTALLPVRGGASRPDRLSCAAVPACMAGACGVRPARLQRGARAAPGHRTQGRCRERPTLLLFATLVKARSTYSTT